MKSIKTKQILIRRNLTILTTILKHLNNINIKYILETNNSILKYIS